MEEAHQRHSQWYVKACKPNSDIPVGTELKSSRAFVSGAIGAENLDQVSWGLSNVEA